MSISRSLSSAELIVESVSTSSIAALPASASASASAFASPCSSFAYFDSRFLDSLLIRHLDRSK